MAVRRMKLYGTTDASGDLTVNGSRAILGRLIAVQAVKGTLDNGADLTISTQGADGSKTLLTITNLAAAALYYPRDLVHTEAGAAMTGTAGGDRTMPLLDGTPRLVIAQGGNAAVGGVVLYFEE